MLHKCANAMCPNQFRHLDQGKLFQVETQYSSAYRAVGTRSHPVRKVERYWLCDDCAPQMTLSFENGGVTAVPLAQARRIALQLPLQSMTMSKPNRKAAGPMAAD